jgi:hypothetical protein
MRGVEGLRDLAGRDQRPVDGNRTVLQAFGERFSFQEFHDEKRHAVELADVVNRADVRVGDSRHGAGFALKPFELRPGRARRRQDLDRDRAIELWVSSVIDLAHASGAERRKDFISANSVSDGEVHERLWW